MIDTQLLQETMESRQTTGFSATTGENIGYEKGAKLIKNYYDQNNEISSHFIGRNVVEAILAQPGAVGITIAYGLNESGKPTPIVVGVDSKGNYILTITSVDANGRLNTQKGIITCGPVISTGAPMPKDW